MRWLLLSLALVVGVAAQDQTPEAYPGQREHMPPPDGWMCSPQRPDFSVPEDHVCTCQRMAQRDLTTGECLHDADGKELITESPTCAVWCHQSHCGCPIQACST